MYMFWHFPSNCRTKWFIFGRSPHLIWNVLNKMTCKNYFLRTVKHLRFPSKKKKQTDISCYFWWFRFLQGWAPEAMNADVIFSWWAPDVYGRLISGSTWYVGRGQTSVEFLRFTALKWRVKIFKKRKMTSSANIILWLELRGINIVVHFRIFFFFYRNNVILEQKKNSVQSWNISLILK